MWRAVLDESGSGYQDATGQTVWAELGTHQPDPP
jgi:hypothetical protein